MTFIVRKKILGATKYVKGEDGTYYNGYYLKTWRCETGKAQNEAIDGKMGNWWKDGNR